MAEEELLAEGQGRPSVPSDKRPDQPVDEAVLDQTEQAPPSRLP